MSLTDNRLIDSYGNPISAISCNIFEQMNNDKESKKQLVNYYLNKPLGIDEYYNKLLECTNKNKNIYEKKLKFIRDPKYMNNVSKNDLEKIKTEEENLRLQIRKTKKTLKNICTKKKKFFCRLTENKISKIINSEKKNDIIKVQRFKSLKKGIDICNKNNICMDFRMSISNIPKNSKYFYMTIQDLLLSPLIKKIKPIMSKKKENYQNIKNTPSQYKQNFKQRYKGDIKKRLDKSKQSVRSGLNKIKNQTKILSKKIKTKNLSRSLKKKNYGSLLKKGLKII